jgi:demethylmenaquinone methyltransferase/2-methoxy-6-polyprenyl-1,4-benzoquinol methylase
MLRKAWNTLLFIWAAVLGTMVGLAACVFILLKEKLEAKDHVDRQTSFFLANKKRAIVFYRFLSKVYDIVNPFFYDDAMRKKVIDLTGIHQGSIVLDIGCGTGYTTEEILERLAHGEVIGIDLTPQQLKKAVRRLKSRKVVLFLRGDAENLPFRESVFDAVVSVGAMEYFPDPKQATREMARVVKLGGRVVVGAPEVRWFKKAGINRTLYTPSREEVQGFYREAGLKEVEAFLTGINSFLGTERYAVIVAGKK